MRRWMSRMSWSVCPRLSSPRLAEHQVEVQFLGQAFPELQGEFVDVGGLVPEVVGPDDLGVAPGVAASDVPLFQDGDAADAMLLDQVVGGGEPVAAAADDDHVVSGLRIGTPPGALPILVVGERVPRQAEEGILLHREAEIIPKGGGVGDRRGSFGSLVGGGFPAGRTGAAS